MSSTCYKCNRPIPDGETECESCARGIPPEMAAMMGAMKSMPKLQFVEIDWEKIRALPLEERINAMSDILESAIPAVLRNTPQYFRILKYIKT